MKHAEKAQTAVDEVRGKMTVLRTTAPEYKANQIQRSLHLRAVEEMKYHKFAQWNTF
jgi:hypothetical protein